MSESTRLMIWLIALDFLLIASYFIFFGSLSYERELKLALSTSLSAITMVVISILHSFKNYTFLWLTYPICILLGWWGFSRELYFLSGGIYQLAYEDIQWYGQSWFHIIISIIILTISFFCYLQKLKQ